MKTTFLSIVVLLLVGCSSKPKVDYMKLEQNQSLLTALKEEPNVKEAIITEANVLYVSVSDDGTPRDGYAEYLCAIVGENQASPFKVKVVKSGTAGKKHGYGELLGESTCK